MTMLTLSKKKSKEGGRRDISPFGLETVRDIYFKIEA